VTVGAWFATHFDDPQAPRDLPAVFTSGRDPAVLVADQVIRGVAIVGRVNGMFGAVALKVRTGGRAVRVKVDLHLDVQSELNWSRVASPGRGRRELPRLVMVRAQGLDRVAVLLRRQRSRLRMAESHAWVEFDLRADEVGDDDLLIIELADATLPPWATSSFTPMAAVGLRINKVDVAALENIGQERTSGRLDGGRAQLAGLVSAGGLVGAKGRTAGRARSRFVVVNADADSVRCRLRTFTVPVSPHVLRQPRTKWLRRRRGQILLKAVRVARRGAQHGLFKASPFDRPPRPDRLVVRAGSLVDGTECDVIATPRGHDLLDVVVTRTRPGPVLIGLDEPKTTRLLVSDIACKVVELEW
jgi:hypothetical protein